MAYEELVESSKPGEVYNDPSKYRTNRTSESGTIKFVEPVFTDAPVEESSISLQGPGMMQNVGSSDLPESGEGYQGAGQKQPGEGDVFVVVEQSPEFPGGAVAFSQFLSKNIVYPASAVDAGRTGVVYVQFVVEKDGSVTNVIVLKGVPGAPELDQEAVRVIGLSPNWKSGMNSGKPVRARMIQPVRFNLK
jgi:TonB family protein